MSIYTDAQRDAADLAKLLNEDTDVNTRYGANPKKSAPKVIREIGEAGDAAIESFNQESAESISEFDQVIDQYKESRGFNTKGTFAAGFTYELPNDVGLDADGNPWIYNATLPFTVTAGTTPTNPTYTQVVYGNAAQVSTNTSDTVQSFVDSFALKIFQSPTDGGLTEIQTRTIDANEVYEVRKTSDDSLATIYSDAAGTTEIVQNGTSNVSSANAEVVFYIDDGDYTVTANAASSGVSVYNKNDLKAVARGFNILDSQVIYSNNTTTVLDNVLYIYDPENHTSWSLPVDVGAGEFIDSVSAEGKLNTNVSTYTLLRANKQTPVNLLDYIIHGTSSHEVEIQKAIDVATARKVSVYAPDYTYIVNDEIDVTCNISGQSKTRTVFDVSGMVGSSLVTKNKRWFTSNSYVFKGYEATTKACFNMDGIGGLSLSNFRITGGVFLSTDSDVATLPPVTAIRGGHAGNDINLPSSSRNSFLNIEIRGVHTAFDVTGYILNYSNISIFSCKKGFVASEWNNVYGEIIMESVVTAFEVYNGLQITLQSFINESALTTDVNKFVGVNGLLINGLYLEGNTYPSGYFSFGDRNLAGSVPESLLICSDIDIKGCNTSSVENGVPKFALDYCRGFRLGGWVSEGYNSQLVSVTAGTSGVDLTHVRRVYRDELTSTSDAPLFSTPYNFAPSPYFENKYSGLFTYGSEGDNGSGTKVTWLNSSDGTVKPYNGGYMAKLETTPDLVSGSARLSLELRRKNHLPKFFNEGEVCTIGAWVYVPSQSYRDGDADGLGANMPYIGGTLLGDTNKFMDVNYITNYDKWVLMTLRTACPANLTSISVQFNTSNGVLMPSGTHIYIGGLFICNGTNAVSAIRTDTCRKPPAVFGSESDGYMRIKPDISSSGKLVDSMHLTAGTRITNPYLGYVEGSALEVECNTDNKMWSAESKSLFSPVGIPPVYDLPTTSTTAWGTFWLNSGVLTVNNGTS